MDMGSAPTWLRQVSPHALQNHFSHWSWRRNLVQSSIKKSDFYWTLLRSASSTPDRMTLQKFDCYCSCCSCCYFSPTSTKPWASKLSTVLKQRLQRLLIRFYYSFSLHCALASGAVYCNPSCLRVCGGRALSVTTITRNCVHRSSPNWVYGWR